MKFIGWICATAFLVACIIGANSFVSRYNQEFRREQKAQFHRKHDIRICRLQLGIDKPELHLRPLMIACVNEVTANAPKVGPERSVLFAKAWGQCMPEMNACERALKP